MLIIVIGRILDEEKFSSSENEHKLNKKNPRNVGFL